MSHKNHDELEESVRKLHISKKQSYLANSGDGYKMKKDTDGVDSYYAVNAPAPGTVGVATSLVNKSYAATGGAGYEKPQVASQQYYANISNHPEKSLSSASHTYQINQQLQQPMSGCAVYANVKAPMVSNYASYGDDDDFPPPPPPGDVVSLHSPPSPTSSSYSELRTAHSIHQIPSHRYHNANLHPAVIDTYHPLSHTSSTYESIYEPVGAHSTNQMSHVRTFHGPYASPLAKGLAPIPSNQPILNPDKVGKEAEVDALTNLLVQSMGSSADPEFFGICSRCGDKVMGEGNGCTAMDQVFHIDCFCCVVCLLKLQGKPFYALETKPYCENCYLNTLEKCCVCTKPILDRILRATGKPYHPGCFTCVVCQKSLDGIPFTVDASNQIHCIEDFHKKFAPRCTVCGDPIMPENGQDETVRVVALDRSFHVNCYKCEDCGLVLSSEAEGRGCYPLDNHVLCKGCNAHRVQALTSRVTTEL